MRGCCSRQTALAQAVLHNLKGPFLRELPNMGGGIREMVCLGGRGGAG